MGAGPQLSWGPPYFVVFDGATVRSRDPQVGYLESELPMYHAGIQVPGRIGLLVDIGVVPHLFGK